MLSHHVVEFASYAVKVHDRSELAQRAREEIDRKRQPKFSMKSPMLRFTTHLITHMVGVEDLAIVERRILRHQEDEAGGDLGGLSGTSNMTLSTKTFHLFGRPAGRLEGCSVRGRAWGRVSAEAMEKSGDRGECTQQR